MLAWNIKTIFNLESSLAEEFIAFKRFLMKCQIISKLLVNSWYPLVEIAIYISIYGLQPRKWWTGKPNDKWHLHCAFLVANCYF